MKILTNRAHCAHQYELWKLPIQVDIVYGLKDRIDSWDYQVRPFPANARYVGYTKVKESDYDLIIMHFDEFGLDPQKVHSANWGANFRWLNDNFKNTPKVAICHGTPQFEEFGDIRNETLSVTFNEEKRKKLVEYLKDVFVICNSYQAKKEWGFYQSATIWQGFDPVEFVKGSNRDGIISTSLPAYQQRPHYRGWYIFRDVCTLLKKEPLDITHIVVPDPDGKKQDYPKEKFKNYVQTLGQYSVYFNPTILSPMPRSRGEAMMVGLISVNYNSHDVEIFIKQGVNGFISNDPNELADILVWLSKNKAAGEKISRRSRETAIKHFHINRYLENWITVITNLTGKKL